MDLTIQSGRRLIGALILGTGLVWGLTAGLGFWLAPLVLAFVWSFAVKASWVQYTGALVLSVAGYAGPLVVLALGYPLGKTARLVAAIMGFGGQGEIVWALTFALAILLGISGAWLGHALRRVLSG